MIDYPASFPDGSFHIESARIDRDAERPVRIALRWSLTGTHSEFGHFGEPTDAPVYMMGLSHLELTLGRVVAEYFLVDEVSFWKQILARGVVPEGRG